MFSLRELVARFLSRLASPEGEQDGRTEERARSIAVLQARGNVSLQAGRFVTEDDIAAERERVLEFKL